MAAQGSKNSLNPGERKAEELFEGPGKSLEKAEANTSGAPDNRAGAGALESQASDYINNVIGSSAKAPISKVVFLKRFGAAGGIVVTIAAAILFMISLIPGLGIVSLADTLDGALDKSEPALTKRGQLMIKSKANGVRNSFAESSTGRCNIACKFGTMNDIMLRNMRANGFEVAVATQKFGARSVVQSIKFPDIQTRDGTREGITVLNGDEWEEALKDPSRAYQFYKVFNPISYFLNGRFGTVLRNAFGLDKLAKVFGPTKEKVVESWRKATGQQGASRDEDPLAGASRTTRAQALYSRAYDILNSSQAKLATKVGNVIGGACTVYNTSRGVSFAIKAIKYAKFAQVAFAIINIAQQIKAGDSPSPESIEFVGKQLNDVDLRETITDATGAEIPNPYYNKNAFSSKAFAMASYGDNPGTLTPQEQIYAVNPVGSLSTVLADATSNLVSGGEYSIGIASGLCNAANNPALGIIVGCAEQIATFVASLSTGPGSIPTGAGAAVWCVGKIFVSGFITSAILNTIIANAAQSIINDEFAQIDETATGGPIGDIAYNGRAAIESGIDLDVGMKAGNEEEIKAYGVVSAEIKAQNRAIAQYEAQSTPFDIYNKYSFLGSIASSLNLVALSNPSITSKLGTIASVIPTSLKTLSSSASAAEEASLDEKRASLYSMENSSSLAAIGAASDPYGNPSFVMSNEELTMDNMSNAQWMIDNGQINEMTGKAKSDTNYEKFMKYCVQRYDEDGIVPLGETPEEIESADYSWKVGLACQEESEIMSRYRAFTMDMAINSAMEEEPGLKPEEETQEFVSPLNDGFTITSGFGPRIPPVPGASNWHAALDFVAPNPDVLAIGDGVVLSTGVGVNNIVSIMHNDGLISEYWHMRDEDIVVAAGDEVTAGQKIGKMGAEGQADGVHLHLVLNITNVESRENYEQYSKNEGGRTPIGDFINPAQFFTAQGLPGYEGYD